MEESPGKGRKIIFALDMLLVIVGIAVLGASGLVGLLILAIAVVIAVLLVRGGGESAEAQRSDAGEGEPAQGEAGAS